MIVVLFSHTLSFLPLFLIVFIYICCNMYFSTSRFDIQEFLISSDAILGNAPARIVLIVGGPGSGKGMVSKRLERECGVVHLSSGDLLRDEVRRDTVLGKQVQGIMERGELVSSAVIVTLIRRVMRNHPGKRVLLDGFPRSLQNAHDLVALCGVPELALHLECDDTILMERIIHRGVTNIDGDEERSDDNFHTALKRLRTYHKSHHSTMNWLREQHVPVVNLDCSGTPDNVWNQLVGIGRLMRPATKIGEQESKAVARAKQVKDDQANQVEEATTTTTKPDAA
jgi:adenylate kinase